MKSILVVCIKETHLSPPHHTTLWTTQINICGGLPPCIWVYAPILVAGRYKGSAREIIFLTSQASCSIPPQPHPALSLRLSCASSSCLVLMCRTTTKTKGCTPSLRLRWFGTETIHLLQCCAMSTTHLLWYGDCPNTLCANFHSPDLWSFHSWPSARE